TSSSASSPSPNESAPEESDPVADGGLGMLLIVATSILVGLVVGLGGAWHVFAERLQNAKSERDRLRRALRKHKSEAFRKATGALTNDESETASPTESSADEFSQTEREELREENEQLRNQNETLKERLQSLRGSTE
ncbi:MAG: hypothetical protein ABEK84_00030, partial [Salinibacter sp.]